MKLTSTILITLLSLIAVGELQAGQNQGMMFFLSSDKDQISSAPQSQSLDCVGSIYAGIKFAKDNYEIRNTAIELKWINPDGETELVSKNLNYVEEGSHAYRWSEIILSRPKGGGLFSFMDPSAGMERFIGTWRVQMNAVGKNLFDESFVVEC